jgi:hypothetical protein
METTTPDLAAPSPAQPTPPRRRAIEIRLLTPPEIDRAYRLRHGTAPAAAKAGKVKCCTRKPRRGKVGFLIDAQDAERVWGAH